MITLNSIKFICKAEQFMMYELLDMYLAVLLHNLTKHNTLVIRKLHFSRMHCMFQLKKYVSKVSLVK